MYLLQCGITTELPINYTVRLSGKYHNIPFSYIKIYQKHSNGHAESVECVLAVGKVYLLVQERVFVNCHC